MPAFTTTRRRWCRKAVHYLEVPVLHTVAAASAWPLKHAVAKPAIPTMSNPRDFHGRSLFLFRRSLDPVRPKGALRIACRFFTSLYGGGNSQRTTLSPRSGALTSNTRLTRFREQLWESSSSPSLQRGRLSVDSRVAECSAAKAGATRASALD